MVKDVLFGLVFDVATAAPDAAPLKLPKFAPCISYEVLLGKRRVGFLDRDDGAAAVPKRDPVRQVEARPIQTDSRVDSERSHLVCLRIFNKNAKRSNW